MLMGYYMCVYSLCYIKMIINCIRPFNRTISISYFRSRCIYKQLRVHTNRDESRDETASIPSMIPVLFRFILIRIIENNLINAVTNGFLRSLIGFFSLCLNRFACELQFLYCTFSIYIFFVNSTHCRLLWSVAAMHHSNRCIQFECKITSCA